MAFEGTSLNGTRWTFGLASLENYQGIEYYFDVIFKSNGVLYDNMSVNIDPALYYNADTVFSYDTWADDAYRTIEIISIDSAFEANLTTFLEGYAEFVGYANVTIEYDGTVISGMFDSGAKAIRTQGKFCTSDFIVRYTAPSGGGGNLTIAFYTPT